MELNDRQQRKANAIFSFLICQPPEYFSKTEIEKCPLCDGTGLSGINKTGGTYSWDTYSYCDRCYGNGFIGLSKTDAFKIDDLHFLCKHCEGIGCKECNFDGIVDWVTHMMGR